jgi:hypothetical protein
MRFAFNRECRTCQERRPIWYRSPVSPTGPTLSGHRCYVTAAIWTFFPIDTTLCKERSLAGMPIHISTSRTVHHNVWPWPRESLPWICRPHNRQAWALPVHQDHHSACQDSHGTSMRPHSVSDCTSPKAVSASAGYSDRGSCQCLQSWHRRRTHAVRRAALSWSELPTSHGSRCLSRRLCLNRRSLADYRNDVHLSSPCALASDSLVSSSSPVSSLPSLAPGRASTSLQPAP